MAELPKVLYPCPRWRVHDEDPEGYACPMCNGRSVVMQGGLPIPDDVALTLSGFLPCDVDGAEADSPTVEITVRPTFVEGNTVDVRCPHCGEMNKVAGHVPRDPDKPNSQGREFYALYCGWCGKKFTPPDLKKEEGRA